MQLFRRKNMKSATGWNRGWAGDVLKNFGVAEFVGNLRQFIFCSAKQLHVIRLCRFWTGSLNLRLTNVGEGGILNVDKLYR